jgi:hypothetical protein
MINTVGQLIVTRRFHQCQYIFWGGNCLKGGAVNMTSFMAVGPFLAER